MTAHDVSRLVRLQEENQALLERERQSRQRLETKAHLLRVAGRTAHLGGWSARRGDPHSDWSDETCAIFEVPDGSRPTLAQALEFIVEADRGRVSDAFAACNRGGQPFDQLARITTARGRQAWIRFIGEPVRDGDKIIGVQGAVQDVTELVEAREESRRLLTRLRNTLENADDGYFTLDRDWRFTYVNPAGLRLIARPEVQLIGQPVWRVIPRTASRIGEQYLRRALAEQRRVSFERHVPDRELWFEFTAYPTPDGLAVFFRDITEQKQRSEQLRLLEAAVSRLNDMLLIAEVTEHDPTGSRIIYVNDAFVRRTGYSAAEVIGQSPRMLHGPETSSAELGRIRAALVAGTTVRSEIVSYTKAGQPYWIEVIMAPISDPDSPRKIYVSVRRDITERRAADEALRISAERFRIVAQGTTDAVWEWNIADSTVWWNEGLFTVFGHPVTDKPISYANWFNFIHPDDRDRLLSGLVPLFKSAATTWSEEYRFIRADGSVAQVLARGFVIRDSSSRAVRMVGSMVDITQRRAAEGAMRISAERFRVVAQATTDAVWELNIAEGTVWWSEGLHSVFGHLVTEAPAPIAEWGNMIHPDDRGRVLAAAVPLFKSGADRWSEEFRMIRADGSFALVSSRGALVRDGSGRAVRMVGSVVDITERRQLEEKLRRAQRLEAVGQLTGGVAHDFNNLLTVVMGNAELLADIHANDPDACNLATMIVNAAERGAELTRRLLAFARKQPLAPKATDINRLLERMSALLGRTLGEHIDTTTVPAASLPLAQIDAPQLENAILNLCINARDAMPGGGKLTLETADAELDADYAAANAEVTPGFYVMIAVTDTGVGMPADVVARAFEPFFTTKEIGKGTGLGLSMVYGFVNQSRGHVKIYSEVGVGTTVKLYLPRAVEAGFVTEPEFASVDLPRGAEKVLLVEDDEPVRLHVSSLLQRLGYTVVSVRNGPEALHVLRQIGNFELLFTDIVMPGGMNGVQLAEEARLLHPHLPVLFTSGYTESALIHQDRLKEGVHLLNKPYRRHELASKVRAVLDQRPPT